jgi:hypothetical protein
LYISLAIFTVTNIAKGNLEGEQAMQQAVSGFGDLDMQGPGPEDDDGDDGDDDDEDKENPPSESDEGGS